MLGADVLVALFLRFFSGVIEDPLAFLAQGHFDRRRDALSNLNAGLDLLANRFYMRLNKEVGQRPVFTHETEQEVLGLDT